jgi:putative ABC transport system permease protein
MSTLWLDLRFSFRFLTKNALFSAIAALTLALGIGANSAIFTVVNAVLLKPLPYAEPNRLAMVWLDNRRLGLKEDLTSYANYQDWKSGASSFAQMSGFAPTRVTVLSAEEAERLFAHRVEPDFFEVLGVRPRMGRAFTPEEMEPGHDRVIILSDGVWRRKFGGRSDIVGLKLQVDGGTMTVVGVMPEDFRFPSRDTEVWVPLALTPAGRASRGGFFLSVVARLKPGVRIEQAQSELDAVAKRIEEQFPFMRGYGANAVSLERQLTGGIRAALVVLAGAVAFVLLIACTNVAGLFLARAEAREREIAVRAALGAGRGRLMRQLLTESLVLALGAGVVGLAFAYAATGALVALAPRDLPRLDEIRLSGGVLWFTLGVSLASGVLFGLVPAFRISASGLIDSLREGGRSLTGGVRSRRMRAALVVAEFAMAVLLLAGAGLMIRTLAFLRGVDPGFDPDHVLTLRLAVSNSRFPERAQVAQFYQQLLDRLTALPGVRNAGAIRDFTLIATPNSGGFTIEGRAPEPEENQIEATIDPVTPGFFSTMSVPLRGGRFIGRQDGPNNPPVTMINETMARRFWPKDDPVGKRYKFGGPQSDEPWMTIVGVVADMRRQGLDRVARCETFQPLAQTPSRNMYLVIRTSGDPLAMATAVRAEVRALDPNTPIIGMSTMDRVLGESIAERKFQAMLLSVFSGIALLLAAIGIYGLMYQAVARRTHEIGVRMALGAGARDVLAMILREGVGLALGGTLLGLALALALTRALATLLYGVGATDPVTFAGAAGILIVTAIAASAIPALRATRVDPMEALRYE